MKLLWVTILALSFTTITFAGSKKVRAMDYTCAALQQELEDSLNLYIIIGPKDWGSEYVAYGDLCDARKEPRAAYVKANDKKFCRVGWACMRRP